MSLIVMLLVIAAIGAIAWALITYIPMPPVFRGIVIVVAIVFVVLLLLQMAGGVSGLRLG